MSAKHQWTADVAAHLPPEQAAAIHNGGTARVLIEAKPTAVYCRRCWVRFHWEVRNDECRGGMTK